MSSLADYAPFLAQCDVTTLTQSYRVDWLERYGWCVKVHGTYMAECDTRAEAQRWLAGFLLAASTVEEVPHDP